MAHDCSFLNWGWFWMQNYFRNEYGKLGGQASTFKLYNKTCDSQLSLVSPLGYHKENQDLGTHMQNLAWAWLRVGSMLAKSWPSLAECWLDVAKSAWSGHSRCTNSPATNDHLPLHQGQKRYPKKLLRQRFRRTFGWTFRCDLPQKPVSFG